MHKYVPVEGFDLGGYRPMNTTLALRVQSRNPLKMRRRDATAEKHERFYRTCVSVAVMGESFGVARSNVLMKPAARGEM
jgi:hypothetical protein